MLYARGTCRRGLVGALRPGLMLIRSLFLSGCVLVVRASRVNARAMVSTANPTPAVIGYGRISEEDLDVITGVAKKVSGDKGWKAHESDCVKGLIFYSHPKGGTRWTVPGPDSSTSFVQPPFGSAAWNKEGEEDPCMEVEARAYPAHSASTG